MDTKKKGTSTTDHQFCTLANVLRKAGGKKNKTKLLGLGEGQKQKFVFSQGAENKNVLEHRAWQKKFALVRQDFRQKLPPGP